MKNLASAWADDIDTRGFELPNLEDIEILWENPSSEIQAVFRPVTDTPLSPTFFYELQVEGSSEIPIVLDEEEDEDNSYLTTPVSFRATEHLRLLKSF